VLLYWPVGVAGNDCVVTTWGTPPRRRDVATSTSSSEYVLPSATMPAMSSNTTRDQIKPGDINCRFYDRTYDDVNYYTCTELSDAWGLPVETFFVLNPYILHDCSNIEENAMYCVDGFVEPLRSTDGFCGPHHGNATCLGTDFGQCCNSETFTCGNSTNACADGTCYEGDCAGDSVYSTDGTCGPAHGDRLCAGKWGDCCNFQGRCGTGSDYCGTTVCHSGNCLWPWLVNSTSSTSSTSGRTTTTSPIPSPTSHCSGGSGDGGFSGLCSYSCSFGFCPSPCVCVPGTPGTPPALSGSRGYAVLDLDPAYGPLCDFTCSHGYCPSGVCTTVPYTSTQQPGTVCVRGEGTGGYAGLCSFCCRYGYCPPGPCTCDLYGQAFQEPTVLNTPGKPAPGVDGSYTGLCSYACNHGYCPSDVCV
ncbi:hypothetical protein CONLIGDRAFT_547624, partial [Coniochaeta ligniaria NRRL 30616]